MTDEQLSVLIVDDQPDLLSSARRILRMDGYRIDTAKSLKQLFDRDNWSDYFAILLDRRLSDGMADHVLPKLSGLAADSAIIVVTAYADLEGTMAALQSGVEGFLLKPVDPDHLRARLKRLADLRRAQSQLIHQRAFAQLILDTTRALILVLDREGRVLRVNRYIEELCGFREEELVGRSVIEALIPKEAGAAAERALAASYAEKYAQGTVHPMLTRSGAVCEIAWWNAALKNDQDEIVQLVCAGRDMTEYNRLQEKLIQSERLSAIGEAMAGLAHESRNALQRSQACLDLLTDQLHNAPESLELLESIQRSQDDLHRLYEEVRAYAAPIQIRPRILDVAAIMRKAWDDIRALRNGRKARLEERSVCTDLTCEVDGFTLGQVFRNILENALQACPGPVEVEVEYAEADSAGSPALAITIRDNGPGISSQQAQQVFGSFFTTKTDGTGLGMAIAQRIVHAHRGQIAVNPESKRGAEFVVTLPRKQP